ncbi:Cohesin subunit SA-3 [Rhizoctonia solani]|uniref:Cohesin subunit SA-3 n=1 Tax=Rhizoctonia solani TaxID=456999 RepID=A0A0K6G8T3_9AGAM|nr:Cohesin subunit SA-3 [Rhizoctonia solani]
MPHSNTGNGVSSPVDVIVEQGSIHGDPLTHTGVAPEIETELKPETETGRRRPWYKQPSTWWIVPIMFVVSIVNASTTAPRTELFLKFACDELRPEYRVDTNVAQRYPGPKGTQTNVSLTFIQKNPTLDDHIMKPTLLHPDKRCSQDPAVHRAVAKLDAGITTAEGILSFLALGWWSQYSDRSGRMKVLAISGFTMLIADAMIFLVAFNAENLPGGYRILILGGIIHGLAGGSSASGAAAHAYIADSSTPSVRSRMFSFWIGSVFAGHALGPSLGSWLNSYSDNLLSAFYMNTAVQVIYVGFMAFIIPESLSDEARAKARESYEADVKPSSQSILGPLWQLASLRYRRYKDWNLALIGVAAAAVAVNTGSNHFKYQYAIKTFRWSSVQLGYWLSLVGFWRALYLLAILPIIIKALYAREERSNRADNDDEKEAQVRRIDLLVSRSSLLIDLVGYSLIGIVTSQTPFIGATTILAFGGGFSPSVQSLALALTSPSAHVARREARAHGENISSSAKQEIGRLFGAFAIVHSLGAQVVGPALFSLVFSATVGVYPKAFFWVSAFLVAVAIGTLGAVRLDTTDIVEDPEQALGTPLSMNSPSRAFSIDSNTSAQSDRTIRPLPRTSSPPTLEVPPRKNSDYTRALIDEFARVKLPLRLIPVVAATALIYAGTIAPRTELLVKLACNNLHPGWDLVSNSTSLHSNETTTQSSSHPRGLFERLYFIEQSVSLQKRSQITTPGTSPMCSDDNDVQKEVAKLNTAISLTSGVLSVMTTGWWTQLSDRVGRIRILAIGAFSGLMVDTIFIGVVLNSDRFPGGYWLLAISNMIDGVFGGFSTAVAISHAYISDCVPSTERSRWFSLWTGIIFAGMALGPGFGSLLINLTGNAMLIFYISVASGLIYALYVTFILPESMAPERMQAARDAKRRSQKSSTGNPIKNLALSILGVLAPFTIFFPRVVQRPGGHKKYEWNASFIGLAYASHAVNSGSYSFKYQYAIKAFGWSSTQMGNWLSLLGFTRAFHLTVLLPLILKGIHWLRERKPPTKPLSDSDRAQSVDLLVARASLGVDVSSYSASALVTTSSAFLGTTTILSFGGGYPPAIQSLALALTQTSRAQDAATVNLTSDDPRYESTSIDTTAPDDTGRLLGAMSIVYTLCSQIFGPSLFGALFVATVGSNPRSIFWLSAILNGFALGSLLMVRLKPSSNTEDDAEYVLLNNMED